MRGERFACGPHTPARSPAETRVCMATSLAGEREQNLDIRLRFRGTRTDDDRRVTGTTRRVHLNDSSFDLAVVEVDPGALERVPHAFLTA